MDAVVIATATQDDSDPQQRDWRSHDEGRESPQGRAISSARARRFARSTMAMSAVGRRFMLSGVDPPDLQWSCLPVSERAESYVAKVTQLDDDRHRAVAVLSRAPARRRIDAGPRRL